MNLEQAERLNANEDFKAFLAVLQADADGLMEDLIYGKDMAEYVRTQCKIIVLRGVTVRLQHLLADLKPETPASAQDSDSPA
jgi:hypothetical protein